MIEQEEYNKASSIVDQFCLKKGLSAAHWFAWALTMGLWHLRELKLDTWQDVTTELLPVTSRRTVVMPTKYVDWVKIGVPVGQYVVTMGLNDDLGTLNRITNTIDPIAALASQNPPNGIDFENYSGTGYVFSNYGGRSFTSYGQGLQSKGHFKVHKIGPVTEILLDYDVNCTELYVEYITDGIDCSGETMLHPYLADYFLKGMELTYEEEKNPSATEASIDRKSRDLYWAEKKVRARRNNLTPKTMLQLSRKHVRLTTKA